MTPLTIDGRTGGGQLVRTALSLAALTGTAVEIEGIRGSRPTPGLRPQHCAAIEAVSTLCDAEVAGAEVGSESMTFEPGPVQSRDIEVEIGTAGSLTLVFDAVLPLATALDARVQIDATGGTDVAWSPTVDYLQRVKLPLLGWFGLEASVEVERTGFYPVGGGRATLAVAPSSLTPLDLAERGRLEGLGVVSKADDRLRDAEVAERQARRVDERLHDVSLHADPTAVHYVDAPSPGSALLLRAVYERSVCGFAAVGERGTPSEAIADGVVDRFLAFRDGPASVDEHLGDQLLVPLALAGGRLHLPRVTEHVASNAALIDRFGLGLEVDGRPDGSAVVAA